jgi:quercetin dioxygenase-like cupin family protein
MKKLFRFVVGILVVVGATGSHVLNAQEPLRPKVTPAMKQDLDVPGREGVVSLVEFAPGAAEINHTHPADVFVFVREGEVSVEIEGKPTTSYKAGEVLHIASGKAHRLINNGTVTARTVAVLFAEKGKPITAPVK